MSSLCSLKAVLDRYQRKGDYFFGQILTMNETRARSYEPNLKRQSNEWKNPGSPRPKKVRLTQCALKMMFIVAYGNDGVILLYAVSSRLLTIARSCSTTFVQHSGENYDT